MKKLSLIIIFVVALNLMPLLYGEQEEVQAKKRVSKLNTTAEIVLEPKSKKKAIALSIFLPGLGEHYMGSKSNALRAYVIETGIWSTFFGARWYSGVIRNNSILYAHANAEAKVIDDESYYEAIERFENLEAYNTAVREEARQLYPDSRDKQLSYIEEHSFPDSLWWEWKEDAKLDEYRRLRYQSREMIRNTSYCVGAAILNRIISVIIATHLPISGVGLQIEPNGVKVSFALK